MEITNGVEGLGRSALLRRLAKALGIAAPPRLAAHPQAFNANSQALCEHALAHLLRCKVHLGVHIAFLGLHQLQLALAAVEGAFQQLEHASCGAFQRQLGTAAFAKVLAVVVCRSQLHFVRRRYRRYFWCGSHWQTISFTRNV